MIRISRSREPLDEHKIIQLERQLGVPLPIDYRNFLLAHNGGCPEPDAFPIHGNMSDNYGLIDCFFCVKAGDSCNLMDWVEDLRGRLPPNLLPIASDPGGNLVCLSLFGGDTGRVYFWEHEGEVSTGQVPGYDNVYLIAFSFTGFLDSLTVIPHT